MRNWFELLDSKRNQQINSAQFVSLNLYKETQFIRSWLSSGDWRIISSKPPFTVDNYVKSLSDEYLEWLGVDRETVINWIEDPLYTKLMKQTGVQNDIHIPDFIKKQIIAEIDSKIPVEWHAAKINLFVQNPGDMFPLHYDRFKSYDYDLDLRQEFNIRRWLIMLYDQQPGQCFFMNNQSLSWKAGDVVDWEQTNYHHGTANFGYYPRFSLRITGKLISR